MAKNRSITSFDSNSVYQIFFFSLVAIVCVFQGKHYLQRNIISLSLLNIDALSLLALDAIIETNENPKLQSQTLETYFESVSTNKNFLEQIPNKVLCRSCTIASYLVISDFLYSRDRNEETNDPIAKYWLGKMYTANGKANIGRELMQSAGAGMPLARVGDKYYNESNCHEAVEYYRSSVFAGLKSPNVYSRMIDCLNRLNFLDESEKRLQEGITLWPTNSILFYRRGQLAEITGDISAAKDDYKKSIELDSSYPWAHYLLAGIHEKEGNIDLAISEQSSVANLLPENPFMQFELGRLYYQAKDYSSANLLFERAIKLKPSYAHYWIWLGRTYLELGNSQKALDAICHSINLDPQFQSTAEFIFREIGQDCTYLP